MALKLNSLQTMNKIFILISCLIFGLYSRDSKADSYSAMMETLVYVGVTDKPTVNHNISVYQTILKSSAWHLTCNAHMCGKRTPDHRKYFVLRNIKELKSRIDQQMFYLTSEMVDILSPDINETLGLVKIALTKNDFPKALQLIKKANQELEEARL